MKRLLVLLLLIVLAACSTPESLPTPAPVASEPEATSPRLVIATDDLGRYANNQLIVGFEDDASLEQVIHALDAKVLQEWSRFRAVLLELPSKFSAKKAAGIIDDIQGVRYSELNRIYDVEPNYDDGINTTTMLISQAITVSDPDYKRQWMHRQMNTEAAWEMGATGKGIRIGIHDTFLDHRHPDLVANIHYPGYDGNKQSLITANTPHDTKGFHGTWVAGTSAATANSIGGRGIAYEASIVPLAINDPVDNGLTRVGIINSAIFAVDGPDGKSPIFDKGDTDSAPGARAYVHIVNMSWGGSSYNQLTKDVMDYMLIHGVVLVTSAGNTPVANYARPAWLPGLITVAATTAQDTRTDFSNRGRYLNVAAPGERIWVPATRACVVANQGKDDKCQPDEVDYSFVNGTSFSSPATAGAAALIMDAAAKRDKTGKITSIPLSPSQVRHILEMTARQPNGDHFNIDLGYGLVDAGAAVKFVKDGKKAADGGIVAVSVFAGSKGKFAPLNDVAVTLIPTNDDGPIHYSQTSSGGILDLIDPKGEGVDDRLFGVGHALFAEINAGSYVALIGGPNELTTGIKPDKDSVVINVNPGKFKREIVVLHNVELFDDKLEPNDDPSKATAAQVGTTFKASLDKNGGNDFDFYSFDATKDVSYYLNTESLVGNFDLTLAVGTVNDKNEFTALAQNDNNQDDGLSPDALLVFKAPADGKYYIRVAEKRGKASPGYVYGLDIARMAGAEKEPNGTAVVSDTNITSVDFKGAQAIKLGTALTAELKTNTDDDIFAVQLEAGTTIVVDVETTKNGEPDTMVALYDAAKEQLAYNDDFTGRESRIEHKVEKAGTYYIVIVSWNNETVGKYTFSATSLAPTP